MTEGISSSGLVFEFPIDSKYNAIKLATEPSEKSADPSSQAL